MDTEPNTIDLQCSTCNVQVATSVVATHTHSGHPSGGVVGDLCDADTPRVVTVFSLSECRRCKGVFLSKAEYYEIPGEVWSPQTNDIVLYPSSRKIDAATLPQSVAKAYSSATGSFNVGLYEPCVIMCRKCVEALCHENGITTGNLKNRIDRLRSEGHIDQKLYTWATSLRLAGNDAAHDITVNITKDDASDSIEFLEALLLYSFVLDRKFHSFQQRRDRLGDNSVGQAPA